ncbi:hypothetical protein ACFVFF_09725 [Streptomyces sp. NPDC057680]|uniref:hypothetical protein n=1 Tax=Streptomyces sp. NPDC057680 TaxID=3346208 RepID=UPI0036B4586E
MPAAGPAPRLVPFAQAAHEHLQQIQDVTHALTPTSSNLGPYDVPAYGYLRSIILDVHAFGGSGSGFSAAEDAPWSVISEIALVDTNGTPVVGPFSGYDLYLVNKYGGYAYAPDPKLSPMYSGVAASDGGFRFCLRVPVEFSAQDGLGSLPNANAASTWKVRITLAPANHVYGTTPSPLPSVRVRMYLDAWSQPSRTDPEGNTTAQAPPAVGTTSYWSKIILPVSYGFNTLRLLRVGAHIRNLLFVCRNTAGSRSEGDAMFPDTTSLFCDTHLLKAYQKDLWKHEMFRKTGLSAPIEAANGLDSGVYVEHYCPHLDGRAGDELHHRHLATTRATRCELMGSFSAAGTLTVLTNDVVPAPKICTDEVGLEGRRQ